MVRPDDVPPGTDFHLFKDGIKPAWEDGNNARGGQWVLRLQKGLSGRCWEEVLLAIIGEQFDVGNEICGAVVSVRYSEDIIYVWNRNADNKEATDKIRDLLRRILALPQFIGLEYRKHQDSLSGINTGGNIQYGANSGSRTPWQRNSSQQQRQSGGSRSGFDRDRDRDRDREDSAADGGLSNVFGKDSSADRDRGHDRDWYSNRPNWDRRSSSNRESDYEKEKDMQRWGAIRRGTGASRDANRDAGFARSGDTERDWSKLRSGSMGSDGSGKVSEPRHVFTDRMMPLDIRCSLPPCQLYRFTLSLIVIHQVVKSQDEP
ncbi:unnamed protein product, partial [Chrysoparadoxa australica]